MKEKVVFDTNIIRNQDVNTFFGGREELERFTQVADIVIPETVIQEIKRQKRKSLDGKKNKFLSNPFHKILAVNENDTKAFSINDYIEKLIGEESFIFEVIDIKNNDVLIKIKELAINKLPPFESGDNTDKGFKDALIYFSVLEYLEEIPNKYIFVCAKDGRLKEALDSHENIIVVESYDEFKEHSISQFFDDYFLQKVSEHIDIAVTTDSIKEYWDNINENKVLLIEVDEEEYVVEIDSNEIVNSAKKEGYKSEILSLINSGNFTITDKCVEQLKEYSAFFDQVEIKQILEASYENTQIKWIIEKPAIKDFLGPLYLANRDLVENEIKTFLNKEL